MTNLICTPCLPLVCLPSRRFSCIFLFGQCNKKVEEITKTWPNASWSTQKAENRGRPTHLPEGIADGWDFRKVGENREDIYTLTKLFLFASQSVWDSQLYCRDSPLYSVYIWVLKYFRTYFSCQNYFNLVPQNKFASIFACS